MKATVALLSLMPFFAFASTPVLAQISTPGISLQKQDPDLTEEEVAKRAAIDRAYRAATSGKTEARPTDPWGNVRGTPQAAAAPTAPAAKPSQQPPKKLNLSTP